MQLYDSQLVSGAFSNNKVGLTDFMLFKPYNKTSANTAVLTGVLASEAATHGHVKIAVTAFESCLDLLESLTKLLQQSSFCSDQTAFSNT